jgi:hypothetical protein
MKLLLVSSSHYMRDEQKEMPALTGIMTSAPLQTPNWNKEFIYFDNY